jgi:hypothetical protein
MGFTTSNGRNAASERRREDWLKMLAAFSEPSARLYVEESAREGPLFSVPGFGGARF